ncbi:MAG: hypothetical protein DMG13_09290 [Acidobacteria bacterium]|nr:MAG: hypothetical protein DMG13_09290 [Acidobacteriota bacterium]
MRNAGRKCRDLFPKFGLNPWNPRQPRLFGFDNGAICLWTAKPGKLFDRGSKERLRAAVAVELSSFRWLSRPG